MGVRAGNTSGFNKAAFGGTMAAIAARSKRYAMAPDPADEAAAGGFMASPGWRPRVLPHETKPAQATIEIGRPGRI